MSNRPEKKLQGKLKLNKLSENALNKREMRVLKGGCGCQSTCDITSVGASAVEANGYAN